MADYSAWMDEQIRLIILKELATTTPDPTLTTFILVKVLESFSYKRTPDYVRNQLLWLEKQAGAVRTSIIGTEMAATLTKAGRWHVERRHLLSGIQNPSDID
jgi:hypothetical protein